MAEMRTCDACHGTGIRLDPTCAGNVYTDSDTLACCRWCGGTGCRTETPQPEWTPPNGDPAYDTAIGEVPDWMTG